MVMGVRRKTAVREVDAPAIEKLAARRDGDDDRGVAVLRDTDDGGSLPSSSRHFVFEPYPSQSVPSKTTDGRSATQKSIVLSSKSFSRASGPCVAA